MKTKIGYVASRMTAIYLLCSFIIVLMGIILLIKKGFDEQSIGASLIAGGIAAGFFTLIRFFDDKDMNNRHNEILSFISEIGLSSNVPIFKRFPKEELSDAIAKLEEKHLNIDVLAMSLAPFYDDFFNSLVERGNIHLRLISQNPYNEVFSMFCKHKMVDSDEIKKQILLTSEEILTEKEKIKSINTIIELKWFDEIPSITLTRINENIFVRVRLLREYEHSDLFFERYNGGDHPRKKCYLVFKKYYEDAWKMSKEIKLNDLYKLIEKRT